MNVSRALAAAPLALAGLGFAAFAPVASAGGWSVTVGGYGSGHHYGVGYSEYSRSHRGYRHAPVTGQRHRGSSRHYVGWQGSGWYGPVYGAPRWHVHVAHYGYGWYPRGYYGPYFGGYGYVSPVVVREYRVAHPARAVRYHREVRYYDARPVPRRGYDRVGYGDQYLGPAGDYEYDDPDAVEPFEEDASAPAYDPLLDEDRPARIVRD
jgi:hypothetical protein